MMGKKFNCDRLLLVVAFLGVISPVIGTSCDGREKDQSRVLVSRLAGSWYPGGRGELTEQLAGFFKKADVKPKNNVIALIMPHAGYRYSGRTAAFAANAINKNYKRIVVIGPSHRVAMEEMFSVPRATHYQTPLGRTPLDVEFIEKLLKHPLFQNVPRVHEYEHSVQIELPILQYKLKGFKLVPIVAGTCSPETVHKAARILKGLIDNDTLVVASSDFVHYGPNYRFVPFRENIPKQIKKLDMGACDYIKRLDAAGFLQYKDTTGATICGYIPIAVLLSMVDKKTDAELLKYAASGEMTGDFSNSVSYLSVSFSGAWTNHPELNPSSNNLELSDQDKKTLLALARKSILHFLQKHRVPEASELNITVSEAMKVPRAAFVTFKKHQRLRGCIGDIFPRQPLYKSVILNAINAGVNDRRFDPVTQEECSKIRIEISALAAPRPVASPEQIRIGTDGVILSKDGKRAVYLPQVAPEQGWNLEQTLTHLSQKAGLAPDAWKTGAAFQVFQAVVFGESEI